MIPDNCWWYTGGVYLLLCYFLIGPMLSRKEYQVYRSEMTALILWMFTPVVLPFLLVWIVSDNVVRRFLCWLIFGSTQ